PAAPAPPSGFPLRFDIRILAPSSLRVENNLARIVASAELTLQGTYDRPLLFGRADIERGELTFEGNRYLVTRGSIDFTNPARIEPFFDIEAETRVRVPGQTYRVTIAVTGTADRISGSVSSDPPLPTLEVVALILGEGGADGIPELRALETGQEAQTLLRAGAARLLATPLASPVGRAVEQAFGVDTVQITPLLAQLTPESPNPAARVTIGKRLSSRVYVTYSRALGTSRPDEIILIEYDQSDRVSWILSRNEDRTFAIDVRVRHTF
ncbi:MAG TPA: translocation/assembly module TamB domain-containing protein, partial [Vicinamibacterales bacterium]|nr:translocation/assembly module TamB domain-containing protein [Vicinamibacterales bacterium]